MERALTGLARMASRKSTKDLNGLDKYRDFPVSADAYEILDDCGRGVSATVHRALCKPLNEIVAIKKMNLESLNCDLDEIIHEAQTMRAYSHSNVLPLYCSFVSGQDLWMVMPFVSGGSVLHIMKYGYPEGLDEVIIATIMRSVLKALEYVHKQGGIHRDIKAGNILIDNNGHVQLGDFGVAASMERTGSWGHDKATRMTFVGTPCWMAPEVMEQTQGYDRSADLWSFGITLLEMAHGHAPFAKYPPMKVLLMTLQNPPPTLDDQGKKHFSKAMRDVVTRCLQKDPGLRPTASQLLEHKFFKQARDEEFLARHLMAGLPPLKVRVQEIRQGRAATNATDNEKNFVRSQDEYKKGISSWNFDVASLKAAAALEPGDEEVLLPTIVESEEVLEGTLSGLAAHQAAAFVAAQQPAALPATASGDSTASAGAVAAGSGTLPPTSSAFASLQGQQHVINTSLGPATAQGLQPGTSVVSDSGTSGSLEPLVVATVEASRAPPALDTLTISPGAVSPLGLSREGSVAGPLASLATLSTPTASKQKIKQQGRFQVYEPGKEPPHMAAAPAAPTTTQGAPLVGEGAPGGSRSQGGASAVGPAGAPGAVPEGTTSATSAATPAVTVPRISEDGILKMRLEVQDSSVFEPGQDAQAGVEPKKKGRFLVMEQAGGLAASGSLLPAGLLGIPLTKTTSAINLTDSGLPPGVLSAAHRVSGMVPGNGAAGPLPNSQALLQPQGKPPVAPSVGPGAAAQPSAAQPSNALLPRLQELLEHASQQAAALGKLVSAVQEAERPGARLPPLLSRTVAYRPLFTDFSSASGNGPSTQATSTSPSSPSLPERDDVAAMSAAPVPANASGGGAEREREQSPAMLTNVSEEAHLRALVDALRLRLAEAEASNTALLARNLQLEAVAANLQAAVMSPGSPGAALINAALHESGQ
ncbi:kinase-like domain-containing protein [Haematococcus lacustris]